MFNENDPCCPLCGRQFELATNYVYRCFLMPDHHLSLNINSHRVVTQIILRIDNLCVVSNFRENKTYFWKALLDKNGRNIFANPHVKKSKLDFAVNLDLFNRENLKKKIKTLFSFS